MSKLCKVANCPATTTSLDGLCSIHKDARLASELHIAKDLTTGCGGETCVNCRRRFRADDWVALERVETTKRRKHVSGYQHIQCEPKLPTKRERAEQPKPILLAAEETSPASTDTVRYDRSVTPELRGRAPCGDL